MAQNPFSPQSNMSFFGGVNDMSTMLPGGRSTFNSAGPATAAAPATAGAAVPAADPNSSALANAAAALGTGSNSAATGVSASPFALASNLNFAGAAAAPADGSVVGGGVPNPNAVQGPQYAPAGSGFPGSGAPGDRPQQGTAAWYAQQNTSRDYNAALDALNYGGVSSSWTPSAVTQAYRSGDTSWESILAPEKSLYSSAKTSPTGILTDAQGGTIDLNSLNWMNYRSQPALVQDAWMNYTNSNTQSGS